MRSCAPIIIGYNKHMFTYFKSCFYIIHIDTLGYNYTREHDFYLEGRAHCT